MNRGSAFLNSDKLLGNGACKIYYETFKVSRLWS